MAGLAAEGLEYDKVVGQSADLFTLQVPYEFIISSSVIHCHIFFAISSENCI
jgi:hypothetical protein